ncbi:MAG: hypothetical protein AMXMBFR64_00390 [Myxococcales bacterium]
MSEVVSIREATLPGLPTVIHARQLRDRRLVDNLATALGLSSEEATAVHVLALLAHDPAVEALASPYRVDPDAPSLNVRDLLDFSLTAGAPLDLAAVTHLERQGVLLVDRRDPFLSEARRPIALPAPVAACLLSTLSPEDSLPPCATLLVGDPATVVPGVKGAALGRLGAIAGAVAGDAALLVAVLAQGGEGASRVARRIAGVARRHVLRIEAALLPGRADDALAMLHSLAVAARCQGWVLLVEGPDAVTFPAATWSAALDRMAGLVLASTTSIDSLPAPLRARLADLLAVNGQGSTTPMDLISELGEGRLGDDWDDPTLPHTSPAALEQALRRARALGGDISRAEVTHSLRRVSSSAPEGGAWLLSPKARLADMVLEPGIARELNDVAAACRVQADVLDGWGFRGVRASGHGVGVLLDGPPGTGKTMAAHALAHALGRPVLQVDVPSVLSRWLGETEQRLAELFRRARAVDAVLLFDEADSFFARRTTDVKGANDRYANVEVNTVLQLLEQHEGVIVLTTNLAEALDPAVRRRLRYRLTFAAPGVDERESLWRRNLPPAAPVAADVDPLELAECYELTGAHVANAALRAAARAASEGSPITQVHLKDAARAECRALGMLCRD